MGKRGKNKKEREEKRSSGESKSSRKKPTYKLILTITGSNSDNNVFLTGISRKVQPFFSLKKTHLHLKK